MDKRIYVHAMRLKSDYESMHELEGSVITWKPLTQLDVAKNIYPDKYEVTFHILAPTTKGDASQHVVTIDCSSPSYPNAEPVVKFMTAPVMHPHVYDHGRICIGRFLIGEMLAAFCIRIARFIQFDPILINEASIASKTFHTWYKSNLARFPMDHSPLPSVGQDAQITFGSIRSRPAAPVEPSPGIEGIAFRINRRSTTNE